MPRSWKVSSSKAYLWKGWPNCNPHLTHLSPVSGSIFQGINAPAGDILCSSAVSESWPGRLTGRKRDSLTCLPPPSPDPALSCFLTPHVFCSSQTCGSQRNLMHGTCPGAGSPHSPVCPVHLSACLLTRPEPRQVLGLWLKQCSREKDSLSRSKLLACFLLFPFSSLTQCKG